MAILSGVSAWEMGPVATGFFIAFVFLVVGCFLDAIPAIIIVGTILDPLARIGRPRSGPLRHDRHRVARLRAGDAALRALPADRLPVAGIPMKHALKDTMIMLLPMLGVLALLIVWPQVALFIPSLISPEFLR